MKIEQFITQHEHKQYCEIVIAPNGDIEYAIPSHLYKLIRITEESKDDIDKKMSYRAAPLEWLIEYTGYGVAWYDNFIVPYGYTDEQIHSIQMLINNGIMSPIVTGKVTQEKTTCELLDEFDKTGDKSLLDKIIQREILTLLKEG